MIDLTISIVNYNTRDLLEKCLRSIQETTERVNYEIIVIDNASWDGSGEMVRERFPEVALIQNEENLGFNRAHNLALKRARGRYVLLLNPDTVVLPKALDQMVEFMEAYPDAGMAGCRSWVDSTKTFQVPALKVSTLVSALVELTPFCSLLPYSRIARRHWRAAHAIWEAKVPLEVEGIYGGFMMLRAEVIRQMGLLDEGFPLWYEEADLSRRIRGLGKKIYFVPRAEIFHYHRQSQRQGNLEDWMATCLVKSRSHYYRKYYGRLGVAALGLIMAAGERLARALCKIAQRPLPWFPVLDLNPYSGRREILLQWRPVPGAVHYLVEISFNLHFAARAGVFVWNPCLPISSELLENLSGWGVYLRVSPIFPDGSVGRFLELEVTFPSEGHSLGRFPAPTEAPEVP